MRSKGVITGSFTIDGIKYFKVEVEFLGELVPPLLHQTTRHHNDGTLTARAQN